jgi:PadR family transcriptional regulator PadR
MNKITLREEFIMLTILNLHEEAYLKKISDFLSILTQKNESKTSVHGSLCRLVDKGFLISHFGGISHKRGGRRKKIYSLSNNGMEKLIEHDKLRQKLWEKGNLDI